ncbi:MAG: hypothetical protein PHO08_09090 [Methylococcales bacterium]|nr:hypothetical protein [Methylococcales bacterium]MDD5630772.1 hypothetical protein [Methylococcales bacterium]
MKELFSQKGVGLIEVLIAGLVFAIGITAVVQLQGTFFTSSSAAYARSIAMSIAQEKIEDLRGFQVTDSSVVDIFDFTSITANGGGRCTEQLINGVCNLAVPSGSLAKDNITFNRSWAVTNYYYTGAPNNRVVTTTPSGDIVQKQVTVTVGWTDIDGTAQTASLSTVINKFSGAASTGLIANNIGGSGNKPVVHYTPSVDSGVVAVSVGVNVNRETLIPTTNGSNQVKFTAYTYGGSGNLLRQEDFLTVSCDCEFTTAGNARTPGYAKWDSSIKSYKDYDGDLIIKDKGQRSGGGQDEMCDICCQDHHDAGASAVDTESQNYCDPATDKLDRCYDPFRGSSDYAGGKHNHYTSSGAVASTGPYLEACRMKRINGFWRVYQDWHRVDLSVFPISEITAANVNNNEAAYVGYVKDIVDAILKDDAITRFNGQTFTKPTPKPASIDRTSSNPIALAVDQQETLTGRAVFVDYLSADLLSKIRIKIGDSVDYLVDVPFYEVDITNRAPRCAPTVTAYGGWCSPANNTVHVGAGDITDKKGNGLAVGQIEGAATTSASNITFEMRRSNSGLMGLTSPVDANVSALNPDIVRDIVSVAVNVTGTGGITHTLSITLSGGIPISGTLVVTPTSGTGTCNGSDTSYSCTVPNSVGGSLTFNGMTATETCSGTSSYTAGITDQSITMTITCAPNIATHTLLVTLSGGTPATGTLMVTPASGIGSCTGSGASYSCTVPNSEAGSLSFTGLTSAGASCSGTGSYTSSLSDQSTSMTITCQAMRSLTACVTSQVGTKVESGTTIPSTAGSCGEAGTCGSGNKGLQFSCSVPNGLNGTLNFVGLRKDGASTANCIGSATFNATDASVNLTCI